MGVSHSPDLYQAHARWGYSYRPDSSGRLLRNFEMDTVVHIDAAGFHDGPHDLADGGPLILALGDSFTAALHVPVEETWTQVLQRELRASCDPELDVLNLGLDGSGTDVHLRILEDQLALRTAYGRAARVLSQRPARHRHPRT